MSDFQPTFTSSDAHPCVTVEKVTEMVAKGTTEKRAVAIILNQNGYTHQQGGDAMKDLFGTAVKSGGFGNLVNDGKDDVGIDRERTGGTGGTAKVARELDPIQELRDQLDRERTALETVEKPVIDAQARVDAIATTPDDVVQERQDAIDAQIKALTTEAKALLKDPKPYLDSETEKANARVSAAKTAAGERAKVHGANIVRLETVLTALDAVAPVETA